jgi:hypothetical protein
MEGDFVMKIGHIIIDYYAELFIQEDNFSLLNKNSIDWFPVLNKDKANEGWVWFSSSKEYHKAKKLLRNNRIISK